jgi:hypothetical protein
MAPSPRYPSAKERFVCHIGFGSGRYGGSPTVESGLTLDINRLFRQKDLAPGARCFGTRVWHNLATGEQVASIGYEAALAVG